MPVDEKALQAAIPVGSNFADAHLVRAIIAAYEAAKGGAPAGWVMVPREPTPEMVAALRNEADVNGYGPRGAPLCYRAMLAAAPAAPPAVDLEKVEEALGPFDDALGEDDEGYGDGLTVVLKWGAVTDYSVTLGDLRELRRVASDIRKARE
jgi:hypothetical protein